MLITTNRTYSICKKDWSYRFLVFRDCACSTEIQQMARSHLYRWYKKPCIISQQSLRLQLMLDDESCFTVCIKITSNNLDSNYFAMSTDPLFYFYFLHWSNIFIAVFYLPCTKLFAGETKVSQRQIFLYGKKEVLIKWVMFLGILNTWMKS